jgi:hypothetical protein
MSLRVIFKFRCRPSDQASEAGERRNGCPQETLNSPGDFDPRSDWQSALQLRGKLDADATITFSM